MNRRDIFIMMYYYLDAYWDEHQTEELGEICSDLNPFLWGDESSANPSLWEDFTKQNPDKNYSVEEGYDVASLFISRLNSEEATAAMADCSLETWKTGYDMYLNTSVQKE